jgi:hypothetical protein
LATLADIGFPAGDPALKPIGKDISNFWLTQNFFNDIEVKEKKDVYKVHHQGVPVMNGRHRRCASQQGNCLYFSLALGLADAKVDDLAERLLHWQWPDGGWNCDKDPKAAKSSFIHTTISLRALSLYAKLKKSAKVKKSADKAAEVLLSRHLFKRKTNGKVIHPEFTYLHYPLYWHYDILGALKILAEGGYIRDKRCGEALDLLESKELEMGGWPAEKKYYKKSSTYQLHGEYVDWGPTGKKAMNEWVSADALYVLKESGRLK